MFYPGQNLPPRSPAGLQPQMFAKGPRPLRLGPPGASGAAPSQLVDGRARMAFAGSALEASIAPRDDFGAAARGYLAFDPASCARRDAAGTSRGSQPVGQQQAGARPLVSPYGMLAPRQGARPHGKPPGSSGGGVPVQATRKGSASRSRQGGPKTRFPRNFPEPAMRAAPSRGWEPPGAMHSPQQDCRSPCDSRAAQSMPAGGGLHRSLSPIGGLHGTFVGNTGFGQAYSSRSPERAVDTLTLDGGDGAGDELQSAMQDRFAATAPVPCALIGRPPSPLHASLPAVLASPRAPQELDELRGLAVSDARDSWRLAEAQRRPTTAPSQRPMSAAAALTASAAEAEGGPVSSEAGGGTETEAELRARLSVAENVMRKLYRKTTQLEEQLASSPTRPKTAAVPYPSPRSRSRHDAALDGAPSFSRRRPPALACQAGTREGWAPDADGGGDQEEPSSNEAQALFLLQQKEADLQKMRDYTSQLASRLETLSQDQLAMKSDGEQAAAAARNAEYRDRYMRMRGEYRQLLRSRTDSIKKAGKRSQVSPLQVVAKHPPAAARTPRGGNDPMGQWAQGRAHLHEGSI